jgi:hypothetical protein
MGGKGGLCQVRLLSYIMVKVLILFSVTPLRANFMHVDGYEGEFKL